MNEAISISSNECRQTNVYKLQASVKVETDGWKCQLNSYYLSQITLMYWLFKRGTELAW